jgi:multidrug resistance efflux pump
MSLPNRRHALPWVLGLALMAFTLVGAKLVQPTAATPAGNPAPPSAPAGGGTIVLGVVESDPPVARVGPPAVAALATVTKVFVADGQEVRAGQKLVQFDDAMFRAKLDQAKAGLAAAEADLRKAAVAKQLYLIDLTRQTNAVEVAKTDVIEAEDALRIARNTADRILNAQVDLATNQKLTEAQKEERRREDLELKGVENRVRQVRARADDEHRKLEQLRLKSVVLDADADQAAANVSRYKATVAEAEAAIDALLVKAPLAGVVESLEAAAGETFGPATRHPVLLVVPTGGRVVRAEVEAEFVTRIGPAGTNVTVTDASNLSLTYPGVVRRVGTTFVAKRSAADALTLNPPKALECVVELADPTPAGKPPLRVGQPVRVVFP